MDYKEFIKYMETNVAKEMRLRGLMTELSSIRKSGDRLRDCLLISRNDDEPSPAIYLDDFYGFYENGEDPDTLVEEIIRTYDENCIMMTMDLDVLNDWSRSRENITCRVMNEAVNRKYLEDTIYIKYLDLAIVIYHTFITESGRIYSCKVTDSLMESWGTDRDTLYRLALENTRRLFGINLQEMKDAVKDILGKMSSYSNELDETLDDPERMPMYILTNNISCQGAVNIFMDDVLKALAENLGSDLYIIPSSIHEVMIIPVNDRITESEINKMINEINLSLLDPQDILSNHLYYYSKKLDRIIK